MIKIEQKGRVWKFDPGKIKPNRTLMLQVGEAAVEGYKYRLDKGRGIDDAGNEIALAPLSALTVGRKGSSLPLVDTGGMQDSFRVSQVSNTRAVLAFTPEQALKAAVHQRGAVIVPRQAKALRIPVSKTAAIYRKKAEIPARPHMGLSKRDREDIRGVLRVWMRGVFKD